VLQVLSVVGDHEEHDQEMRQRILEAGGGVVDPGFRREQRDVADQQIFCRRRQSRGQQPDTGERQHNSYGDRRVIDVARDRKGGGAERQPQRMRERLHALAHVPHGTVAVQNVVSGAKADVRVVADPGRSNQRQRENGGASEKDGSTLSGHHKPAIIALLDPWRGEA
jgi:hypothetical protein